MSHCAGGFSGSEALLLLRQPQLGRLLRQAPALGLVQDRTAPGACASDGGDDLVTPHLPPCPSCNRQAACTMVSLLDMSGLAALVQASPP